MSTEIHDALHEHFFDGMTEAQLDKLAKHAECVQLGEGDAIFRQDEPARDFWVITRGRVALEVASPSGSHVITTITKGDVLGVSWLFPPHFWKFDAVCLRDCAAVRVDGHAVRAEFDADPALGCEIYKRFGAVMAKRLQATRFQLLDVYG
jgi:CRP-like cAMP-binding protein